jgi:hypothetical protein
MEAGKLESSKAGKLRATQLRVTTTQKTVIAHPDFEAPWLPGFPAFRLSSFPAFRLHQREKDSSRCV